MKLTMAGYKRIIARGGKDKDAIFHFMDERVLPEVSKAFKTLEASERSAYFYAIMGGSKTTAASSLGISTGALNTSTSSMGAKLVNDIFYTSVHVPRFTVEPLVYDGSMYQVTAEEAVSLGLVKCPRELITELAKRDSLRVDDCTIRLRTPLDSKRDPIGQEITMEKLGILNDELLRYGHDVTEYISEDILLEVNYAFENMNDTRRQAIRCIMNGVSFNEGAKLIGRSVSYLRQQARPAVKRLIRRVVLEGKTALRYEHVDVEGNITRVSSEYIVSKFKLTGSNLNHSGNPRLHQRGTTIMEKDGCYAYQCSDSTLARALISTKGNPDTATALCNFTDMMETVGMCKGRVLSDYDLSSMLNYYDSYSIGIGLKQRIVAPKFGSSVRFDQYLGRCSTEAEQYVASGKCRFDPTMEVYSEYTTERILELVNLLLPTMNTRDKMWDTLREATSRLNTVVIIREMQYQIRTGNRKPKDHNEVL